MKKLFALAVVIFALSCLAPAQINPALRPPQGAQIAIVVFEDLECPSCGNAEPLLMQAVAATKIPLVRHDFPIPSHAWSFEAHVIARYFDTRSPALGEEFRHWVFGIQSTITKVNLRGTAERFAADHKITLPADVDPNGELAAKVRADFETGKAIGVYQTPTIFVVSNKQAGVPFAQVGSLPELLDTVEKMKKDMDAEAAAKKK
jgi:protein-disulfide isomerase